MFCPPTQSLGHSSEVIINYHDTYTGYFIRLGSFCLVHKGLSMKLAALYIGFLVLLLAPSLSAQTQPQIFYVNVYEGTYPDIMNAYGANTTAATNHWTNVGLPGGRRASIT